MVVKDLLLHGTSDTCQTWFRQVGNNRHDPDASSSPLLQQQLAVCLGCFAPLLKVFLALTAAAERRAAPATELVAILDAAEQQCKQLERLQGGEGTGTVSAAIQANPGIYSFIDNITSTDAETDSASDGCTDTESAGITITTETVSSSSSGVYNTGDDGSSNSAV